MITLTSYRAASNNPAGERGEILFSPSMDSWDPENAYEKDDKTLAPTMLTYRDAKALYASNIPDRKLITYKTGDIYTRPDKGMDPHYIATRMTQRDFFEMFEVPFLYGGPWDAKADQGPEPVIVLSKEANKKAFGGENSVGKTLHWKEREFRVVGILDDWEPMPKYFDVSNGAFQDMEGAYVPFAWGPILELGSHGNTNCWKTETINSFQDFLNSECIWFAAWVELRTAEKQRAFKDFMDNYVLDQKKHGRFPRPLNNYLYDVSGWMKRNKVVEDDNKAMLVLAFAFLRGVPREHRGLAAREVPERGADGRGAPRTGREPPRHLLAAPHRIRSGGAGGRRGRGRARRAGHLGAARLVWTLRRRSHARAALRWQELRDCRRDCRGCRASRRPLSRVAHRPRRARLLPQGAVTMEIRPILSALLRNRAGAILVALQIAITLAIVVNAIYVTQQRLTHIGRPTGLDDQNIFSFWVTTYEKDYDYLAMVNADMALLRQMPGIIDAAPMSQMPLSGSGSSTAFYSLPDKKGENSPANYYLTDNHAVKTLGVTLSAGTEFDANAVEYKDTPEQTWAPVGIISTGLAKALFKDQPALGKTFYDDQSNPIRVIGVISHVQGSWVGWDKVDRVMLTPRINSKATQYAIRTRPGELDRVMADVEVALRKRDPNRVIATPMKKMSDMKLQSYAGDSLMAVTLSTVTGLVLVFSALGIFGLATFNVNTRTRQIGTRRAVGARKRDIVRYFMTENWLITDAGRAGGLLPGAGRRVLAIHPVPAAAPRPVLPGRGRRGPVAGRPAGRLAALPQSGKGLSRHGHPHGLKSVRRLQP